MRTKTLYVEEMCERLPSLTKAQVELFMKAQEEAVTEALNSRDPEGRIAIIPGVVKLSSEYKAPTKERQVRNPVTGDMVVVPEKPASRKLRARFPSKICIATGDLRSGAGRGPDLRLRMVQEESELQ